MANIKKLQKKIAEKHGFEFCIRKNHNFSDNKVSLWRILKEGEEDTPIPKKALYDIHFFLLKECFRMTLIQRFIVWIKRGKLKKSPFNILPGKSLEETQKEANAISNHFAMLNSCYD